ncbi:MAG: hypothetical protein COX65_08475 [Elusimicrobia bacterium CG_4_10_14_0_2_um_filter_56_8]|nr:MAG: hypothetical protein AUJ51_06270 [Elusimicrobia bacterium CG1_02_56_21]PJA12465.1 MAG: hypothetical protein COX65_08475 [Elusimicrobia bacterium CG_4_10_14_0_2_um_filter_56_8]
MPKKLIFFFTLSCLGLSCAVAANYDNSRGLASASLKPFARDLGSLLGSGSNQTARPLGFAGFDLGVRAAAQFKPSHGNTVLKKNNLFGLGFIQAEIGMPYRIDGFIRGGAFEGISVAGGGLRYGLWNVSDEKYKVNAMLVGMANMAAHRYFYAIHFNTGVVCSFNIPVLAPYLGFGYDFTRFEPMTLNDAPLAGKKVYVSASQFTAGARAKFKLGYFAGGLTYTHDRALVNASAGFRF